MNNELGICSNCIHLNDCRYRMQIDKAFFHCDEHESSRPNETVNLSHSETPADMLTDSDRKYRGLCMNCDNRETCKIEKPETGIWHCEEYR